MVILFSHDLFLFSNMSYRDRRKLTFYFIAEKRIDFRELVRELFRQVLVFEGSAAPIYPYCD
jgi:PSP1 C-terminal conserved region